MVKALYQIVFLIFFAGILRSGAQSVEVSINRNSILIGEQVSYGLKVNLPGPGYKTHFSFPDSVAHFEILRKEEVTALKGINPAVEQVITFTSFDSGTWYFPSIPVLITNGAQRLNLLSDSIRIEVGYMPIDSTGKPRDIKAMMDVKIPDYTLYYILGGILLALLIAYLIYRYFKKRKERPAPIFKSDISAFDEAMNGLNELESENLLVKGEVKNYHTRLTNIFRHYYTRVRQVDMHSKTTGDLLVELRSDLRDDQLPEMASVLRLSDAVKFAKFQPGISESTTSMGIVKKSIQIINQTKK